MADVLNSISNPKVEHSTIDSVTTSRSMNFEEQPAEPLSNGHSSNNQKGPATTDSVSASITLPPNLAKDDTLSRAERALQQLLDHSHELTTKLREKLSSPKNKNGTTKRVRNHRSKHRNNNTISEEVENAILQQDQETESLSVITHFERGEQPSSITGGTMYDYQIEALNWMIQLFELNRKQCFINGILADDMGLGKTLMTISMLSYLKQYRNINGPHIVIVPLTTSNNWIKEFRKWNPSLNVFLFHGDQQERAHLIDTKLRELSSGSMDVVITSYEMAMIEKNALNKIKWEYMIIDEAHRIKNDESKLSRIVRLFSTKYRLLLTGTPLQNNMKELWSLLNFLTPELFTDSSLFTDHFSNENLTNRPEIVHKLHQILRPFMLRRLKKDVSKDLPPKTEISLYCGMSALQKKWYKNVLSRNLDEINAKSKSKTRLLNILMQLRKCCNHPYLFEGAEEGPPFVEGPHLYENCGKLSLLDKLLTKLFANGSRVLIFSQMTRMLDILQDYMALKEYPFCRIDGSTKQVLRNQYMDEFNAPDSDKKVFLLSTRAGGLGINLQTADIVVLYDSDWNPQMDIQAQDRAHRIGQKKPVFVYRLITEHSVEEKILDRCMRKLYLNAVVVRKGAVLEPQSSKADKSSLRNMVTFGAEYILRSTESTISDTDIDAVIQIGKERTEQNRSSLQKAFDHNVMDFKMDGGAEHNYQTYEGTDYSNARKENERKRHEQALIINYGPRQRNVNVRYRETEYYKDLMQKIGGKEVSPSVMANRKTVRKFKVSLHSKYKYDFQFVTNLERVHVLEQKAFDSKERIRVELITAKEQFEKDKVERRERERIQKMVERQKLVKLRREIAKNGGDSSMITELRSQSQSVGVYEDGDDEQQFDEKKEWQSIKKEIEDRNAGLKRKEEVELKRLTKDAMNHWNSREYNQFIKASVENGKDAVEEIAECIDTKSLDEVTKYHAVFWKKYKKLSSWKKVVGRIEEAEEKREENERIQALLLKKVKDHRKALRSLKLCYEFDGEKSVKTGKGTGYTPLFDRFLVIKTKEYGLDSWNEIKRDVMKSGLFWNNWFLRSKTENEIKQRTMKLLHLLDVEAVHKKAMRSKKKKSKSKSRSKSKSLKQKKSKKRKKKSKASSKSKSKSKSKSVSKSRSTTNSPSKSPSTSRGSSVSTVSSNKSRKRLSKQFIERLVSNLRPDAVLEIYDEEEMEWNTFEVIKHIEKDLFSLFDSSNGMTVDLHFKTLEYRMIDENSDNTGDVDDGEGDAEINRKSRSTSGSKSASPKRSKKRKQMEEDTEMVRPKRKRRKM